MLKIVTEHFSAAKQAHIFVYAIFTTYEQFLGGNRKSIFRPRNIGEEISCLFSIFRFIEESFGDIFFDLKKLITLFLCLFLHF